MRHPGGPATHPLGRPRGTTAVIVALFMASFAAFVALAINVGHMMAARSELQTAADSAALSGAQEMALHQSTTSGYVNRFARSQARGASAELSAANISDGASIDLNQFAEVTFGQFQAGAFTPTNVSALVNAVQVQTARASGAPNGPLTVFMSSLLDPNQTVANAGDVSATAIAMVGGRCDLDSPVLPMAVQNCTNPPVPSCGGGVFAGILGNGTANFTTFNSGTTIANIVNGAWAPTVVHVGDCIDVNPPLTVTPADLTAFQAVYTPPSATRMLVPIICGAGICGAGQAQVLGFAAVTVNSVVAFGPPGGQGVNLHPSCGNDNPEVLGPGQSGACANYGALFVRPRLVQ